MLKMFWYIIFLYLTHTFHINLPLFIYTSYIKCDASSLPHVETWQHRPLLLCSKPEASENLKTEHDDHLQCPIGVPFKFSSDIFEGEILVRLKGCGDDPRDKYFSGRKRLYQHVVQGRFKEEVRVSDVFAGYEVRAARGFHIHLSYVCMYIVKI